VTGPGGAKDPYGVLGVSRDASQEDIKKAYRKLVRTCHPDANPGDAEAEQRFKAVNEAYRILGDPEKRERYDRFGVADDGPGAGDPFGGGFGPFGDMFGDIFENMFGGGGRNRAGGPRRGDDVEMVVNISLKEAFSGVTREVALKRMETCDRCGGSGAEPGTGVKTCPVCGGSGQVEQQQNTPFGTFVSVSECRACGGTGKKIEQPCGACHGAGKVQKQRKVEVRIPAGVDTGTRLRIGGEGREGLNGGPPGDLYIAVRVEKDRRFERDRDDLHTRASVSFPQAALGSTISVDSVDGGRELEIPPGSQGGSVLRIKGSGMPRLRGSGRGELYVHLVVEVPKKMTERERTLVEALAREMKVEVRDAGLVDKLKQFFG